VGDCDNVSASVRGVVTLIFHAWNSLPDATLHGYRDNLSTTTATIKNSDLITRKAKGEKWQ